MEEFEAGKAKERRSYNASLNFEIGSCNSILWKVMTLRDDANFDSGYSVPLFPMRFPLYRWTQRKRLFSVNEIRRVRICRLLVDTLGFDDFPSE